jgi:hypothetical protein
MFGGHMAKEKAMVMRCEASTLLNEYADLESFQQSIQCLFVFFQF